MMKSPFLAKHINDIIFIEDLSMWSQWGQESWKETCFLLWKLDAPWYCFIKTMFVLWCHSEVYSIQYYVIKLFSDFRRVCGILRFPPPIKLTVMNHDIIEILLKAAFNTITSHLTMRICQCTWYIRLKIKPNSVRIRFLSYQIFVLPSTGF